MTVPSQRIAALGAWSGREAPVQAVRTGSESRPHTVSLSDLLPGDSPRLNGIDENHARILAETDERLEPILVHASSMRIIDGMHRVRAAQLAGRATIEVRYFVGDEAQAFVLGVQANVMHGLPLSLPEREAAAARILRLYPEWSNRAVARASGLSDKTVATLRQCSTADFPRLNTTVGCDGRVRPRDASDARRRAGAMLSADPAASSRSVARAVGLSPATVRDVKERLRRGEDPALTARRTRISVERKGTRRRISFPPNWNRHRAFGNLRNDPSLRLNEAGKVFLRWLEVHVRLPGDLESFVHHIPPHCAETLSLIARDCSNWWGSLADLLTTEIPQDEG